MDQAVALQQQVAAEASDQGKAASQRLIVDLAHACFATGKDDAGKGIMRQVAAENNEDGHLLDHINQVFAKTGQMDAGKALLDQVSREIVDLNNRGVMAARAGDFEGSVQLLIQAAEQVPNLQFLVNAAKAIFTLVDRKGWDAELAGKGYDYLQRAQRKDPTSPKVISARELYATVSRKYGATAGS